MTDFTLSSNSIVRPFRSPWGAFPTRGMPISTGVSTTTIHLGGLVALDNRSTGQHRIFESTGASAIIAEDLIVGIAAQKVSGSTATVDTVIPVWEANPMVEFKAVTKGAVLANADIGATASLGWDSTLNIVYVDLADSTAGNNRVIVTQHIDAIGDSGGYVAFKFMQEGDRASTAAPSSIALLAFYSR